MKKIYLILFTMLFGIMNISYTNANVDKTNAFNFTYDCVDGQGILKTDFNLGGHHHYYRQYHINKPGIIEIKDSNHTTVSKSTNISISGCNYTPAECNITNEGVWEYLEGQDEENQKISIETNLDILVDNMDSGIGLILNGSGNTESINIYFSGNNYNETGKNIRLNFLEDKIELIEYGLNFFGELESQVIKEVSFINRELAGKKEFYYTFSGDNKEIKLFQRKFKKVSTGIANSSDNVYDVFSAYDGTNTGGNTCSDPDGKSNNGYCTGLNYWDYNQHHYTTTKVKLYSVNVECSKIEYSDGGSEIISESYDGTLSGIIKPIFSGPTKINGQESGYWGYELFSTDSLYVEGLKYDIVGEIGDKKLGVKRIITTIKEDDITLGSNEYELSDIVITSGYFNNINIILKNNNGDIITKKTGNYQLVFTFFDENLQQLGSTEMPLTILPNNNFQVSNIDLYKTEVFATNNVGDKIKVCAKITDDFGNEIDKEYSVNENNISIIDGVKDLNNNEGLEISNVSFKDSEFCFELDSLVPTKKKLKFEIKVPKHKENVNMDFDGTYKILNFETPEINFKQPLKPVLSSNEKLQLGKTIKYNINLENEGNLYFNNGNLQLDTTTIKLLKTGDYWQELKLLDNSISRTDLEASFSGIIDANENILEMPNIKLSGAEISYITSGKTVKYILQDSNMLGSNCNLDTLGVKIIGDLQGDGKASLTGQDSNVSDLSKSDLRKKIRSNAYRLIKNLPEGQKVNGVLYYNGRNVKYSEVKNTLKENETLIIKDGNFVIDEDINKFIGIIVLKDNYKILSDYDNAGNVYVNNNVQNIDAIIYADGAFRSARSDGSSYDDSDLNRQLKLNGSLFTRNTIGGAVLGNSNFTLPGGEVTTDYNLASIYDLNYIRKVSPECDASGKQKEDSISFIIKYNPSIQTNPPKIFGN